MTIDVRRTVGGYREFVEVMVRTDEVFGGAVAREEEEVVQRESEPILETAKEGCYNGSNSTKIQGTRSVSQIVQPKGSTKFQGDPNPKDIEGNQRWKSSTR